MRVVELEQPLDDVGQRAPSCSSFAAANARVNIARAGVDIAESILRGRCRFGDARRDRPPPSRRPHASPAAPSCRRAPAPAAAPAPLVARRAPAPRPPAPRRARATRAARRARRGRPCRRASSSRRCTPAGARRPCSSIAAASLIAGTSGCSTLSTQASAFCTSPRPSHASSAARTFRSAARFFALASAVGGAALLLASGCLRRLGLGGDEREQLVERDDSADGETSEGCESTAARGSGGGCHAGPPTPTTGGCEPVRHRSPHACEARL